MICPQCGNENPPKLKFCVNCGVNLENPQEVNYEQVDMGGYHTEEEPSGGGFKLGSGTFTISDRAPQSSTSDLYTADELNEDEEEFDFSDFDEPFIPKLDAGRVSLPHNAGSHPSAPTMQGIQGMPAMPQNMYGGFPQPIGSPQPVAGMPGAPAQGMPQMNGMPQAAQQAGMPVYGQPQPVMYAQPQIVGYDQNGMPVYGQPQPMMYAQPQIIGYDQNGMPVYGQPQPMMYAQPQIIGYDQNGMPVYGQPQPMMYAQPPMVGENGEPIPAPYPQPMAYGAVQGMPPFGAPQQQPQKPEDKGIVDVPDDFWEFFDGGKSTKHPENDSMDDFFGKHSNDMGGVSADSVDLSRLKKFEKKRVDYMGDTPLVDAAKLVPNTADKFNKMYMRKTESVNADDLAVKEQSKPRDYMAATKEVDADRLNSYEHVRSRVSMSAAGEADADDLQAYVRERKEAIMSQDIKAVEAMPKKKSTYNDEIDAIVLPEYMQARKTVKDDSPEIPGLPEI